METHSASCFSLAAPCRSSYRAGCELGQGSVLFPGPIGQKLGNGNCGRAEMTGHWRERGFRSQAAKRGWAKLPGFSLYDPLGTIFTALVSVLTCGCVQLPGSCCNVPGVVTDGSDQRQQSLEGHFFPTTRLHRDTLVTLRMWFLARQRHLK